MADSAIVNALIADPNEALGSNPWYNAGVGLAKQNLSQYVSADDKVGAFLAPVLQGLLSGGLAGYGKRQVTSELRPGYSELFQKYGTSDPTAKEGWSPWDQETKMSVAQALLNRQEKNDMAKQLRDTQLDIEKAKLIKQNEIAAENAMLPTSLQKVPKALRTEAIKELGQKSQTDTGMSVMEKLYDDAKDIGTLSANVPYGNESREFTNIQAGVWSQLQKTLGRSLSDYDAKRVAPLIPSSTDTVELLEDKKKKMRDFVAANKTGTPLLDMYNQTVDQTTVGDVPSAPAGYRNTGKQDANGNWIVVPAQ